MSDVTLSEPVALLINCIAREGQWPEQYKVEWGFPITNVRYAEDESQAGHHLVI